jgi:signal transduction histidine kinase
LRAAAAEATVPTRVEAPSTLERFSPEIEATVYFCCVEALDRVQRAERATIQLSRETDTLAFAVAADGTGPDPWTEQDLLAVGDRLGAAGGRLTKPAAPAGGACLCGTVPLAAP